MIRSSLENFAETIVVGGEITVTDVRRLQREILTDGLESADEADLLIALDRAVARRHGAWSAFVIGAVTDFVVWTSRPTGFVDHGTATWLVASLAAGSGPTPLAEAIAFEIVREAERCDETLLSFVLKSAVGRIETSAEREVTEMAA